MTFPPTIILRHRRENLKKCSLRGLESREDMHFFTYPKDTLPNLDGCIMLSFDGAVLSKDDADKGLFLIDATWRYAEVMQRSVLAKDYKLEVRSLPSNIRTAYPRRQDDCDDPERGLASVEALYVAYLLMGRDPKGILDKYHWKEKFLLSLREVQ